MRIFFEQGPQSLIITDMPEELARLAAVGDAYEITCERIVYLFKLEKLTQDFVQDSVAMSVADAANLFFLRLQKLLEM